MSKKDIFDFQTARSIWGSKTNFLPDMEKAMIQKDSILRPTLTFFDAMCCATLYLYKILGSSTSDRKKFQIDWSFYVELLCGRYAWYKVCTTKSQINEQKTIIFNFV